MDAVCHNPANDNVVRPHSQTFTDSDDTGAIEPTNGRLTVPPVGPVTVPGTTGAACPNPNWRLEITNITRTFTYTLTIGNRTFFQTSGNF